MRALVTGATGFIGSNVARELLADGVTVRVLARPNGDRRAIEGLPVEVAEGDLLDPASLRRAVEGCDVLYHVGALYAFWVPDQRLVYRTNVDGTRSLLEAARDAGVSKVVYTSSVATIGLPKGGGPSNEQTPTNPKELIKGYKESKYLGEQEALRFAREGLPVVIVNPTAPVGPWDVKPTPTGRVIRDFLRGKMFAYVDTGLNVVHVRDVARGHILAAQKGKPGERYILGNRDMSLREIFETLARITGRKAPKLRVPNLVALGFAYADETIEGRILRRTPFAAVGEVKLARKHMYFDCSKAVRELGMPQTPPEQALEDAVRWYREHKYA